MTTYPNNWIKTIDLSSMTNTIYDFLIVGSGAGASATLYRLCQLWEKETSIKIAMIEKGDKLFSTAALNLPTMNESLMQRNLFPDNSTPIGERLPNLPGAREVYSLGGRTLFWNGTSPRPPKAQLDQWPIDPQELDLYFSLAERLMHVTPFYATGSLQEELLNRLYSNDFLSANFLPLAIHMNGTKNGKINSNPWFSSINFLAMATFLRPFDLTLNANVSRVLVEKNKVIGVEVFSPDKTSHILRAKNVILSASTLESPRILLNSGIKGDAIGRYLTNHILMVNRNVIKRDPFNEELGALAILIPEDVDQPYQIQISGPDPYFSYSELQDKKQSKELSITQTVFGKVESQRDNRVVLDPSSLDEYGLPMIQVYLTLNEKDNETKLQMIDAIKKVTSAMDSTSSSETPIIAPPGRDSHESCTCRMGTDPETSTVDPNSKVHGIKGLYLSGNSVLPTLSVANPTLSSTTLAIRLADHLTRIYGRNAE